MGWLNPEGFGLMPPVGSPISLRGGGSVVNTTINSNVKVGNLWTFLGSPSGPRVIILTVDGADAECIQITTDWTAGSTFQLNVINGGRIVGSGGAGGKGGDDNGASGTGGLSGGTGGTALQAQGFNVDINIDDGFLFGGGGGGGGSSSQDLGPSVNAGGGGGGGQGGLSGGAGGAAGGGGGASAGTAGSSGAPGVGGAGAGGGPADGGNGQTWGVAGDMSYSDFIPGRRSGTGGQAGLAYRGIVGNILTFNGSKSKATLITEGRIKGEVGPGYVNMPTFILQISATSGTPFTMSWAFLSDGALRSFTSLTGASDHSSWWRQDEIATVNGDYEVQAVIGEISSDVWDNTPGADGTWFALSSSRTWSIFDSTFQTVTQLYRIRDANTLDVLTQGWLQVEMEDGS
jgi:hypothetical protein